MRNPAFLPGIIIGILVLVNVINITQGCKDGLHAQRRKRQASNPTSPEVDEKLAGFFENCLKEAAEGIFPSLRSAVDYAIRDSDWYKNVRDNLCANARDIAECWITALQLYLDVDSSLYKPTAQCICDYDGRCSPTSSERRRKRSTVPAASDICLPSWKPSEMTTDEKQISDCIDIEAKKFVSSYPSLSRLDGASITIFLDDHYTYCRNSVVTQFPYAERVTFSVLYLDEVCPKTGPEAAWRSDINEVYGNATRMDSPVGVAYGVCRDQYGLYGQWTAWTACTKTCGGGESSRERKCPTATCLGEARETTKCNTAPCADNDGWTICTRRCGGGFQTRRRKCASLICYPPFEQRRCNMFPCRLGIVG